MKRRVYLASLVALTTGAGCISSTATTNRTSSKPMKKTVSVTNRATNKKQKSLKFDVEVINAAITASSTARITLKYTNTGEDTLKLNINPEEPDPVPSVEDTPGLILLSEIHNPKRRSPECWKPTQESFPQPGVAYHHPIQPGQTVALTYEVWADPHQEADCIRPGEYRFKPLYGSITLTVARDRAER